MTLLRANPVIPYKDLHRPRSFPLMTVILLSANISLFLYQVFLTPPEGVRFITRYSVIPLDFKNGHPSPFTLFSAMFLHAGWLHLIGNMLYLWIFGDNVEDRMGKIRFLFFYLLSGLVATLAQIYSNFDSRIPSLGASGAIAGVLGAYIRFFPTARIVVLVPIFWFLRSVVLPAWLVLGGWVLLQILQVRFSSLPTSDTGGIAYFAHLGGFAAGFLLAPLFAGRKKGRR